MGYQNVGGQILPVVVPIRATSGNYTTGVFADGVLTDIVENNESSFDVSREDEDFDFVSLRVYEGDNPNLEEDPYDVYAGHFNYDGGVSIYTYLDLDNSDAVATWIGAHRVGDTLPYVYHKALASFIVPQTKSYALSNKPTSIDSGPSVNVASVVGLKLGEDANISNSALIVALRSGISLLAVTVEGTNDVDNISISDNYVPGFDSSITLPKYLTIGGHNVQVIAYVSPSDDLLNNPLTYPQKGEWVAADEQPDSGQAPGSGL